MKNCVKKLLAITLAFAMSLTLVTGAFAAQGDVESEFRVQNDGIARITEPTLATYKFEFS